MESIHCRIGYFAILVALLNTRSCFGRPSELDKLYKEWRPLELVRGLRALSLDPFDAFLSLEAIKDLESEEALDVMRDLDVKPITIYDALSDLGIEPFDAYYALKSWLTDPLLHPSGDFYHRVNTSGDPSHPYLHVSYKRSEGKDGKSKEDYKAQFMTSEEVNKELNEIENEYKKALKEDKFKMSDFIKKAKKIHSSFDDPKHVFKEFFGKRHFQEWKNLFPDAFKSLHDIYQNPLGHSLRKDYDVNATAGDAERYKHLHGSRSKEGVKQMNPFFKSSGDDAFSKYKDPSRYETIQDETHVEEENAPGGGADGKKKVHHIKSYFDKKSNMYVECRKTEECAKSGHGEVRRVQSHVRHFDPESYQKYKKTQQGQTQQQQPQREQQQQETQQQPQQEQQQQSQQQSQQPDQQHTQQQQQQYPQQHQQQPPPQQQQYHHQQPYQQQQVYQPQQQYPQQPHQQQYHQQQPQQQYHQQQPQQQQQYHQQQPQQQQYQQPQNQQFHQPQQPQYNQPQQPQYNQPQQQQNYQQQPPPYQHQNNPQQQHPPNQQNTHQEHQRFHQQQKQQWKQEHQNDPTEPSYVY